MTKDYCNLGTLYPQQKNLIFVEKLLPTFNTGVKLKQLPFSLLGRHQQILQAVVMCCRESRFYCSDRDHLVLEVFLHSLV